MVMTAEQTLAHLRAMVVVDGPDRRQPDGDGVPGHGVTEEELSAMVAFVGAEGMAEVHHNEHASHTAAAATHEHDPADLPAWLRPGGRANAADPGTSGTLAGGVPVPVGRAVATAPEDPADVAPEPPADAGLFQVAVPEAGGVPVNVPSDQPPTGPTLTDMLLESADEVAADQEEVARWLLLDVLASAEPDAVLVPREALPLRELIGRELTVLKAEWYWSDSPAGRGLWAIADAVTVNDSVRRAVVITSRTACAQLLALYGQGALPRDVVVQQSTRVNPDGTSRLWLVPESEAPPF